MAGNEQEMLVDMNELIPGQEYTFIFNDGNRYSGILETYLGNPRSAVRLANGYQRNGVRQQGTTNFPLSFVNRVVQDRVTQSGGKKQKVNGKKQKSKRKKTRKLRRKMSRRRKLSRTKK
jgi:hypothetical protein